MSSGRCRAPSRARGSRPTRRVVADDGDPAERRRRARDRPPRRLRGPCSGAPSTETGSGRVRTVTELVVSVELTCDDGSTPTGGGGVCRPHVHPRPRDRRAHRRHRGDLGALGSGRAVRGGRDGPRGLEPVRGVLGDRRHGERFGGVHGDQLPLRPERLRDRDARHRRHPVPGCRFDHHRDRTSQDRRCGPPGIRGAGHRCRADLRRRERTGARRRPTRRGCSTRSRSASSTIPRPTRWPAASADCGGGRGPSGRPTTA